MMDYARFCWTPRQFFGIRYTVLLMINFASGQIKFKWINHLLICRFDSHKIGSFCYFIVWDTWKDFPFLYTFITQKPVGPCIESMLSYSFSNVELLFHAISSNWTYLTIFHQANCSSILYVLTNHKSTITSNSQLISNWISKQVDVFHDTTDNSLYPSKKQKHHILHEKWQFHIISWNAITIKNSFIVFNQFVQPLLHSLMMFNGTFLANTTRNV